MNRDDLSRMEERGEEWKTTVLKAVIVKTAGNIEDSVVEDGRVDESVVEERTMEEGN